MPRPRLPRAALLLKILGGIVAALVVIALVPPLRRAVALGTSKAVLFVASPLAPNIADFKTLPSTTKLTAVDGSVIAELDKDQHRVPVKLQDLPDHVKKAVLAAEDDKFYQHGGIDPGAVGRAFIRTAQGRTQGGSTITQQLAKINYTARQRTIFRKLKEVLYASKLEKKYTKDELLERYVNQIYFGRGAYGINAAANQYFGKDATQLTPAEAATLAGKIRSPEGLKKEAAIITRRNQVLANMKKQRWLSAADYQAAKDAPLGFVDPQPTSASNLAPHFTEYIKREAATIDALGGSPETRSSQLFTGGYTIETTFDPKVFNATRDSVQQRLGEPGDPFAAVATVVPGDGAVRSLFGGLDFATSQFDMSSNPASGRQAGSSFKPFVYLAALRKGIDPRTTFDATSGRIIPCYSADKPVNNYAGEDLGGKITVDEALVHSVNVVFVDLGCQVGVRDVIKTATDDGIPDDSTTVQGAVFLGGTDKKNQNALEMASAYATFAANGVYAKPYGIARIKDGSGKVIYEHKPETHPVFKPEEVGVLNNPLQGVVQRGTGVAANIGRPVAGKTGTTQDSVDAWFIGYTPQLATGVWVGYNDNNHPMTNVHGKHGVTGGSFPAQIFSDVMKKALEGVPVKPIPTASPDQLNLKLLTPTTLVPPPSAPTTTLPPTTLPPTTLPPVSTTTTAPTATTSTPGTKPGPTTTTTAPTTTTTANPRTTTTTSPPTTVASQSATTTTTAR